MRSYQKKKSGGICRNLLRVTGGMLTLSSLMLAKPLLAADFSFSGESTTIFRMRTTTEQNLYPVYEYLHLNMSDKRNDGSAVSFYLGAWGRTDLANKTTDKYTDADLQYGYLSYKAAKNNAVLNLGRQFITEGVASEKIDGLYVRNDFAAGITASAFAGKSVITSVISDPNYKGGNVVYGTHLSQSMPQYYSIGLSALKSERDDGTQYREEEGLDLWVHPMKQVDLTGRTTYNSITSGWMEHAYTLSVIPLENLRISADVSNINYKDYFYHMTTAPLSFLSGAIDPNEKLLAEGVAIGYEPIKNLTVSADYKHYGYEIAGDADFYGGKATYSLPESFSAGFGMHRMTSQWIKSSRLRYTEIRAFLSKKLGHVDLTADFHNARYDERINGVKNSYVVTGSAGYDFSEKFKVGADIEYSKNPDFDNEVRGLIKVTYAFDTKRGEGSKREK